MRSKTTHQIYERDAFETSDLAMMEADHAEDELRQKWARTPDAKPAIRPSQNVDEKLLKILTHHKLMPDDTSLDQLRNMLHSSDHADTRAKLLHDLSAIQTPVDEADSYASLRAELNAADFELDGEPVDHFGNPVAKEDEPKKRATKADLKRIKKLVAARRTSGDLGCNTDDELEAAGLMPC